MKEYDVIIVGGGVSGTALLYTLSKFTSVKRIALLEKHLSLGSVNSAATQNSQTLHFGDIETNYTLEKSIKVKKSSDMLKIIWILQRKNTMTCSQFITKWLLLWVEVKLKNCLKDILNLKKHFQNLKN